MLNSFKYFYQTHIILSIIIILNGFKYCNLKSKSFICKQLNGFKYCYVTLTIQFEINHCTQLNGQPVRFNR